MPEYEGTHGTCISRMREIERNGFRSSSEGYRGSGVYFWAESHYSKDLAIGWYKLSLKFGNYSEDEETDGAIIFARIITDNEAQALSLETPHAKKRLGELYETLKLSEGFVQSERLMSKLHDCFVEEAENEVGQKLALVIVTVNPPKGCVYPIKYLGLPYCYVVKDVNVIDVVHCESLSGGSHA